MFRSASTVKDEPPDTRPAILAGTIHVYRCFPVKSSFENLSGDRSATHRLSSFTMMSRWQLETGPRLDELDLSWIRGCLEDIDTAVGSVEREDPAARTNRDCVDAVELAWAGTNPPNSEM